MEDERGEIVDEVSSACEFYQPNHAMLNALDQASWGDRLQSKG